jgi:hypothetical protein
VIEENIQEVTGPSAIAYGHGQEAIRIVLISGSALVTAA